MYKEAIRPVWAEINLSNLDYNIKNIKAKLGSGTKIIGVVKADGYGHGSVKVAEVLRANGVDTFAVSTLQEAIVLREAGATEQIISLSLTPNFYSNVLVEYDITPVISSLENARAISKTAAEVGKTVSGFIAADTGMGRIGYLTWDENAVSEIKEISQLPNFKIAGLFSHMSTADSADKTFSRQQEQCFNEFYDKLIAAGIEIPMRTFANSASVMELPSVYFDAVRPGIILYGCYPSDEIDKSSLSLKPVMSVKATISHLKDVPAGFSVSYGREFISKRPSKIINKLSFRIFFILIFTKSDVTKLNPPSIYCGQLSIFKYSQVLILYKTFLFRFLFETKNVSLCKNTEGFRKVFKSETISLIFIIFAICMKIEAV